MSFDMVIGFIAGIGLYTGVRTLINKRKFEGIIQLILTFLCPVFVSMWCLKKTRFVFGGTDFEFLVQTAAVDRMIEPWLILVLYLALIILTVYNIIQIIKHR